MQVILLYALVVLIWGSTWTAIPFQLGIVAPEVSVAYRFAIGSAALFACASLTGRRIAVPRAGYPVVMLQGVLLFSASYCLVYYGTAYITSGLVAVMFSLIVLCNAFFERLFFQTPLEKRLLLAAACGFAGISLVFWPEIAMLSLQDDTVAGIAWTLLAILMASLGNMAAVVNLRGVQPVMAVNAHAMGWGALTSTVMAALLGREFDFAFQPGYVVSLLYLAVLGSSVAFGVYLTLIRRIGSARAAYASVLFPVVALGLSSWLEDYRWSAPAVTGIVLTMAGNWLALTRIRRLPTVREITCNNDAG